MQTDEDGKHYFAVRGTMNEGLVEWTVYKDLTVRTKSVTKLVQLGSVPTSPPPGSLVPVAADGRRLHTGEF